jgi:hypothetical protein
MLRWCAVRVGRVPGAWHGRVVGVEPGIPIGLGFDGAYMRFTGQVTVEHLSAVGGARSVTAPGLWELMYFGKTPSDR